MFDFVGFLWICKDILFVAKACIFAAKVCPVLVDKHYSLIVFDLPLPKSLACVPSSKSNSSPLTADIISSSESMVGEGDGAVSVNGVAIES